ncbi:O-antigen ligase family protein [Candidatus Omnitrophota bacterium]
MMVLSFYSAGFDLGPVSAKVYVAVLLFSFTAILALMRGTGIIQLSWGRKIFFLWAALIIWKIIAKTANGFGFFNTVHGLLKNDIIAMFTFLALIYFIRTRKELKFIVSSLIFLTLLSAFVGVMQWLDFSWAWDLQQNLNPHPDRDLIEMNQNELIRGLAATTVAFGYYLATIFPLMIPQIFQQRQRFFKVSSIIFLLVSLFLLQQRSAVLAAFLCSFMLMYGAQRYMKRRFRTLIFVALILLGGSYVIYQLADATLSEYGRYDMYRINRFTDPQRIEMAKIAIEQALKNPFFGTPRMAIVGRDGFMQRVAPHNLFLNTFLYYGIFGLALTCFMLAVFFRFGIRVWRAAWATGDFISIGLVLGLTGYTVNSMFHNASFVTGDYLFWWVAALLVASEQIRETEKVMTEDEHAR